MMSQARFNAIYNGMTSAARKVYDVVPIAEAWDKVQIARELRRLNISLDIKVFDACLGALRDAGLIRELHQGEFQREKVREEAAKPANHDTKGGEMSSFSKMESLPAAPAKKSPLDRLGELAQRATQLAGAVSALASDISDAAVDIQAQLENTEEGVKKLRQLQTLLKSLGGGE